MSTSLSPGQALVRVGLALVLVGAAAAVVTLVPLFTGTDPLPVAFYLAAMLSPVGLGLILLGLWRSSRARTHRRSHSTSE